jgi:hypothetical protein
MGGVVMFALFLAAVGAIAAQSPSGRDADGTAPLPLESPIPVEITVVPPEVTPEPDITGEITEPDATSSSVQAPRAVASSWSAAPTPAAPLDEPPLASGPARLAAEANDKYGVRITIDGQDWGADEASQEANVQAIISAMERLPDTVISAVVGHAHGPLTFVSNNEGRTLDGWQPYGGHPMMFYTNSDQGPGGHHADNQVVVRVGAASMPVGHEILHAYQARDVGPDEYALALLQPEMRSFMDATGWRQTGTDEAVRQAVNQPWSAVDSLYVYEGRTLTYVTAGGDTSAINAANPFEAFAVAGSIYYTRPSRMPLPDWPEYWGWYQANVG